MAKPPILKRKDILDIILNAQVKPMRNPKKPGQPKKRRVAKRPGPRGKRLHWLGMVIVAQLEIGRWYSLQERDTLLALEWPRRQVRDMVARLVRLDMLETRGTGLFAGPHEIYDVRLASHMRGPRETYRALVNKVKKNPAN